VAGVDLAGAGPVVGVVGLPPEFVAFDAHPATRATAKTAAGMAPTARWGVIRLTVDGRLPIPDVG
jgi:hypothetical protein